MYKKPRSIIKMLNMRILFYTGVLLMFFSGLAGKDLSAAQIYEKAIFAGGCFWCMEQPFEELKGVVDVISGYTGGRGDNPTYEDYAKKGYVEAVEITYDPSKITYSKLLDVFWEHIDPTDSLGQFVDKGPQYATAIFYIN
ncbi:MAG: peptide-methionine (S)-S-oxide reductase MsrA, partial [Candidatus Omnitrophota bacterium]